jgi:GNAT superfamily N-acetyltransferase
VISNVVRRDYQGVTDLPEMIRFCQRIWTPDARWHIGDLAWKFGLAPDVCAGWQLAIWERAGEVIGIGWLTRPDHLSLVLGSEHAALVDDIVDWATDLAGTPVTVTVFDTETWLVDRLLRAGRMLADGGNFFVAMQRDLDDLPPMPAVPGGYTIRPVRADELGARAELHRRVWSPEMTDEIFGAMTRQWPYRREFDWVAQAPDGALVSYIQGWYDDVNRVGEFEPVGTLAEYRRLGLSRAVGIALLHAFRDAGADRALVFARGDDGYPIPRQVYGSLGFKIHGRTRKYRPKQ